MIRGSTLFSFILAVGIGGGLFHVKYRVNNLENELQKTYSKINAAQQSIHILKAEWTYLNNPLRLQKLAEKYLDLRPTDSTQLVALNKEGRLQRNTYHKQDLRTVLASYRGD